MDIGSLLNQAGGAAAMRVISGSMNRRRLWSRAPAPCSPTSSTASKIKASRRSGTADPNAATDLADRGGSAECSADSMGGGSAGGGMLGGLIGGGVGDQILGRIFGSKNLSREVATQASQQSGIDTGV